MGKFVEEKKPGVPAYMVSFGDMMTNLLTFFILLCALSTVQDAGLLARGIGSFIAVVESHGRPGVLSDARTQEIFDHVRRRFHLPPEKDPDRRESHSRASNLELLRAEGLQTLVPHDEILQPMIAVFEQDSDWLGLNARNYIDRIAATLRPEKGQVLILEGHAQDAGERFAGDDRWLAFMRALAVQRHLIEEHDFPQQRLEARAWFTEIVTGDATRSVDARLVTPNDR